MSKQRQKNTKDAAMAAAFEDLREIQAWTSETDPPEDAFTIEDWISRGEEPVPASTAYTQLNNLVKNGKLKKVKYKTKNYYTKV
jgi:hypothetical protein